MYSLSMIVVCVGLTFFYRAMHPNALMARVGVIYTEPDGGQTLKKVARRARLALGLTIMVLATITGNMLPKELAHGIFVTEARQIQAQKLRINNRLTSEMRHTREMIDLLGSPEAYLHYLDAKKTEKIGL